MLPPADQGGLRAGRHPGTDDHDENHAPEPAAGSNSAGTASKDSDTIGTGAIAGIAVGAVVLVVLIAAAAFVIAKKKQSFPGAVDGTMDEIYAARKSAEISRLSGGFTPHLVVTRPRISHLAHPHPHPHASMSRNSMTGPRRTSSSSTSGGSIQRQSFVPGNNLGGRERGAVAKVGHLMARPNPNSVYNSSRTPYDL